MPKMDKYTINEQANEEEYQARVKRAMELIHDAEILWQEKPDVTLGQVVEAVVDVLPLRDLLILASLYLAHFTRDGDDIA